MGNHEYCTECGDNDFHHGRPCNPELYAKHQAWLHALEQRKRERQEEITKRCASAGLTVEFTRYGPIVDIKREEG